MGRRSTGRVCGTLADRDEAKGCGSIFPFPVRSGASYRFALLACLIGNGAAWAQNNQFEGLDLNEPSTDVKPDDKAKGAKDKSKTPAAKPAASTSAGSTSATTTDVPSADSATAANGAPVERDITQDDRVKSVQRKLYGKRHRFELAPYFLVSVNDAFYAKWGGALRAAFYLSDAMAFSVRGSLYSLLPTDDVRAAKRNFQARIFNSVPTWSVMGDLEWSPFYGKAAIFNSILHFDAYLMGGAGVLRTETTALRGLNLAFDLGVGMRFVTLDWLAVNVALINTSYVDQPTGTTKAALQNMLLFHVGVSVFIPFKSTYREAE